MVGSLSSKALLTPFLDSVRAPRPHHLMGDEP
jgi:hypothetical protein